MKSDFISNLVWTLGVIIISTLLIWGIASFSAHRAARQAVLDYKNSTASTTPESTGTPSPSPSATPTPTPSESTSLNTNPNTTPMNDQKPGANPTVHIETSKGPITLELYKGDAPKTVDNFVKLASKGFYDGLTFHRVIKGFMIQGGDPTGNGTGGPGYQFEDELNPTTASYKTGYKKGVLAMANAGPNTNGSQFFIMLEDTPLPHNYTIFGRVIEGQSTVDAIGAVATNPQNDMPLTPVKMNTVEVK